MFAADFAESNRLELLNMGLDREDAAAIGVAAAPVQAAVESLSNLFQLGQFKLLSAALAKLSAPTGWTARRYARNALLSIATEYTEEQLQDNVILPVAQETLGLLNKHIPDVDWSFYQERAIKQTPELLSILTPMALVFGGLMTAADVRMSETTTSSRDLLKATGFSEQQAEEIASLPDNAARIEKARELWGQRTGTPKTMEEAQIAVAETFRQQAAERAIAVADVQEQMKAAEISIRPVPSGWVVSTPDGSTTVSTHQEAYLAAVQQMERQGMKRDEETMRTFEAFSRAAQENQEFRISDADFTMLDSFNEAKARGNQADMDAILKRAEVFRKQTGQADAPLKNMRVLGRSSIEFREGVKHYVQIIYAKGRAINALEEKAESDIKRWSSEDRTSADWLRAAIENAEKATGDTYLHGDTDTALIEAYSDLVKLWAAGTRKGEVPRAVQRDARERRRKLKKSGGALTQLLQENMDFFREVLQRVYRLYKAKKAGKLGDIEAFLNESLGLDEQAAHVEAVTREVQEMKVDSSFSLTNLSEAEQHLRSLSGQPMTTADGLTATVSNQTAGKMSSASAVRKSVSPAAHLEAIQNFQQLFEAGSIAETHPDRANDPNIVALHRVNSSMEFEGRPLTVKFTVKEFARDQGNRIYSIEAMDLEGAPSAGQSVHDTSKETARGTPITEGAKEGDPKTGGGQTHSLALSDRLDALSVALGEQYKTKPEARLALIARAQDRLLAAKADWDRIDPSTKAASRAASEIPRHHRTERDKLRTDFDTDLAEIRNERETEIAAARQDQASQETLHRIKAGFSTLLEKRRLEYERTLRELKARQAAEEAALAKAAGRLSRQEMNALMRTLDAVAAILPAEMRRQAGGFIKPAELHSNAARLDEIERRFAILGELLDQHFQQQEQRHQAAVFRAAHRLGLAPNIQRNKGGYALRYADGTVTRLSHWAQARAAVQSHFSQVELQSMDAVARMADHFLATTPDSLQGGESIEITVTDDTTSDRVARGELTPEQALEANIIAGELDGMTREQAARATFAILGSNVVKMKAGIRRSVSQIMRSGNVLTAVEEPIEGRWKAGLESGHYTRDQGIRWVRLAESVMGEKLLPEQGEISPRALTEAISKVVVADVFGRRKDGSRVPAGIVSQGIMAAAARDADALGLRAFLRAFRTLFGQVMSRARALRKARAEGKLTGEWEAMLDDLLGIDGQQRYEQAAEADANPDTGDATFSLAAYNSIRQRQDKPTSWETIRRGHSWASSKQFLPRSNESKPGFLTRGTWPEVVARVAKWLPMIHQVRDPWGATVKFNHPQTTGDFGDVMENRAAHLLGEDHGHERRTQDPEKLEWIGATRTTVEGAQLRMILPNGYTMYARRYEQGTHIVIVEDGAVANQFGLVTQYAPKLRKKFEGALVEKIHNSPATGAVSQPMQARSAGEQKSQAQSAQTPNPRAHGQNNESSSSGQTHSLRAIPPGEAAAEGGPSGGGANPATGDATFSLAFQPRPPVQAAYQKILGAWSAGENLGHQPLSLGLTPPVMRVAGAAGRGLFMPSTLLDKVTQERHAVPQAALDGLLGALYDPVAIFQSRTRADSLVILTEFEEPGEGPLLAAVTLDRNLGRDWTVNEIASVYGKPSGTIASMFAGTVLYENPQKSSAWARRNKQLLPKRGTPSQSQGSIPGPADVVKWVENRQSSSSSGGSSGGSGGGSATHSLRAIPPGEATADESPDTFSLRGISLLEQATGVDMSNVPVQEVGGVSWDGETRVMGGRRTIRLRQNLPDLQKQGVAAHEAFHILHEESMDDSFTDDLNWKPKAKTHPAVKAMWGIIRESSGYKELRRIGRGKSEVKNQALYLSQPREWFARITEQMICRDLGAKPSPVFKLKWTPLNPYAWLNPQEMEAILPHVRDYLQDLGRRSGRGPIKGPSQGVGSDRNRGGAGSISGEGTGDSRGDDTAR